MTERVDSTILPSQNLIRHKLFQSDSNKMNEVPFDCKRRFDPTFRISVRLLMLWPNEAPTYDDYRVYA